MKISDLFEAPLPDDTAFNEEMLMESYNDFKRVWFDAVNSIQVAGVVKQELASIPARLEKLLKNKQAVAIIIQNSAVKQVLGQMGVKNPRDVGSWLGAFREKENSSSVEVAISNMLNTVDTVERLIDNEIETNTPKYDVVKRTSSYIVFKVHNFAAARKLKNQLKTRWCIGVNQSSFDHYGVNKGRDTYIVFLLKTKTGLVIHSGGNGALITHHNNRLYWELKGNEYKSMFGVEVYDELEPSLTLKEMNEVLKACGLFIPIQKPFKFETKHSRDDLELVQKMAQDNNTPDFFNRGGW